MSPEPGSRDERHVDEYPWADAMQVGPDPALELAQALLIEAQPHMEWRSADTAVQTSYREKATSLIEACPSLGPAAAAAQPTGEEADDVFCDPSQKGRQLGMVIGSLLDTYKPEGVGIWLNSPNHNLGGRPLDLIAAGEGARVLAEADRIGGGPTR